MKSALYFYLEQTINERIQNKQNPLSKYDWPLIVPLMVNHLINKEIILFIEENYKVPYDFLIVGAHLSLERLFLFDRLFISEESLNDFLIFLKIDIVSREILVKRSFRDRSFEQLADFLFALTSSLNQDLIFSDVLKNYNYYVKNKKFYFDLEEIEIKLEQLLELNRDSLQTFDLFSMFDSFEGSKSKTSEVHFFSFYENLLKDSNSSLTEDFIEIFKLFEEFLNVSKDKSILLVDVYFDKSSHFYQFIQSFSFSYQQKIKKILINKSRFLIKFAQAGINYEVLGLGGLLAFIALLNVLGFKPSKRPIYNVPNGCFATMSANFGQNRNVSRIDLEYDASRSASATIQPLSLQQKKPLNLIQNQYLPKKTTLVANRSRNSGIITVSKASLKSKNLVTPSTTKIIVKGAFDGLSSADCMALMAKNVSDKYPGSYITIRPKIVTIDGISQEVNEITISETFSQFGRLSRVKSDIIKGVKQTKGTILFLSPEKYERDHVLNSVTRVIFNIEESRGAAVFVDRLIHNKMGDNRSYLAPDGMRYTQGTGGSLYLIDHFCEQDRVSIGKLSNDPEFIDSLTLTNSSPAQLENAYTEAYRLDRELIRTRMGDQMDENTHLAVSHDNYLNDQMATDFDSLSNRLSTIEEQNIKEAGEVVEKLLQDAQPRREHTYAVKAFLKEGTSAYAKVVRCESRAVNAAFELVTYVENNGGEISPRTKQKFFDKTSSNLMAPDQAYTEAAENMDLKNLKKPLRKLVGPTCFVPNYPKDLIKKNE